MPQISSVAFDPGTDLLLPLSVFIYGAIQSAKIFVAFVNRPRGNAKIFAIEGQNSVRQIETCKMEPTEAKCKKCILLLNTLLDPSVSRWGWQLLQKMHQGWPRGNRFQKGNSWALKYRQV